MPIKILLADGYKDYRDLLKIRLEAWGYKIDSVSDAKNLISKAKYNNYSLIIVDYLLVKDNKDGSCATEQIRKFDKKTPIIMIGCYLTEGMRSLVEKMGANDIFNKLGETARLEKIIKRVINKD